MGTKIKLYKINENYAFSSGNLSSLHHWKQIPGIIPIYKKAWMAMRDARDIARNESFSTDYLRQKKYALEDFSAPVIDDAPSEKILINHYYDLLRDINRRIVGIDDNPEKDREFVFSLIKSQVGEMLKVKETLAEDKYKNKIKNIINEYRKIAQKHFDDFLKKEKEQKEKTDDMDLGGGGAPMAPTPPMGATQGDDMPGITMGRSLQKVLKKTSKIGYNKLSVSEKQELMENYGNCICKAIDKKHKDAICKVFPEKNKINIISVDENKDLLIVKINKNFNICNIVAGNGLADFYPTYSSKFYQRYWKPLVESLGHFLMEDMNALILPEKGSLPDMPTDNNDFKIKAFHCKNKTPLTMNLSFKEKMPIWRVANNNHETISKEYTEEDFIRLQPTRVMCVDPKLSLNGKIGEVVQIIPINKGVGFEVDVNFGRKIIRLSKEQIKIIDEV